MSDATDNHFYREPAASVVDGDPKDAEIQQLRAEVAELRQRKQADLDELKRRLGLAGKTLTAHCKRRDEQEAELADLRASREAWAIEAMSLDVELSSRPTADAYDKACQALELRRVALTKALGLSAATSFYDAVDQASSRLAIPADARKAAIRLVAENQLLRYDSEFDASHLSWVDFEGSATEDIDALTSAGLLAPSVGSDTTAAAALDSVKLADLEPWDDSDDEGICYCAAHGTPPVRHLKGLGPCTEAASGGDTDTTEVPGEQ